MARELKFRAWVPAMGADEKASMIDGVQPLFADPQVPSKDGRPFCMYPQNFNIIENSPRGAQGKRFWIEIQVEAIMQFTGLKDNNRKEIYEGDLLFSHSITASQTPEEIEESGRWVVPVAFVEASFCYGPDGDPLEANECETDMEVIGNIYENPNHPDLLKYEQQALQ